METVIGIILGVLFTFLDRKVIIDKLTPKVIESQLQKQKRNSKAKFLKLAGGFLSSRSKLLVNALLWIPGVFFLICAFALPGTNGLFWGMFAAYVAGQFGKFLDRNETLKDYIQNTISNWSGRSIEALMQDGSPEAVKLLQQATRSQDSQIRDQTFAYLIANGDRSISPVLVDGLRTGSAHLRNSIIEALARIDPVELGGQLPHLLAHRTSSTRVEAYKHIELMEDEEEAEKLLTSGLRDLDGKVRWEAAVSYQKFHSRHQIAWLNEYLNENPASVVRGGAEVLRKMLDGTEWQTIKAARAAMGEIGNKDHLEALLSGLQSNNNNLHHLIVCLGHIGGGEAVEALVNLLGMKDVSIQRAAANTLAEMGDVAREGLLEALRSKNFRKRYGAIGALGYMNDDRNNGVILRHLNDAEPRVRQMAVRIARNIEDNNVVPEILARTEDNAYDVRIEALNALKKIATMSVIPQLLAKYRRLRKRSWESNASYKVAREMNDVGSTIGHILANQTFKPQEYKSLYCRQCRTRATLRKEFQWKWAVCRKCGDTQHLEGKVAEIVGRIGGEEKVERVGNRVFVPLWNEGTKRADFADVDRLQIIGGQPWNYDWAVSAVIGSLQNDTTRKDLRIGVELLDAPELDHNTQRMIAEIKMS